MEMRSLIYPCSEKAMPFEECPCRFPTNSRQMGRAGFAYGSAHLNSRHFDFRLFVRAAPEGKGNHSFSYGLEAL
jgi:hypothetical protein